MPVECGNPLLLQWTKEWFDQAKERNSKGASVYKKAYDSLKACPMVFHHPSEAQQLHGLGPRLCSRLTEKLRDYCAQNGLPMPDPPHKVNQHKSGDEVTEEAPAKRARKKKAYVPALRSGPYAILLALSTLPEDSSNGLTKIQTIDLAQQHCDSSFTAPSDPTKFYTAWDSMKTLQSKDLVADWGRPTKKYALTDEGWDIAKRIKLSVADTEEAEKSLGRKRSAPVKKLAANHIVDLEDDSECHGRSTAKKARHQADNCDPPGIAVVGRQHGGPLQTRDTNSVGQPRKDIDFLELLSSPMSQRNWKITASNASLATTQTSSLSVQLAVPPTRSAGNDSSSTILSAQSTSFKPITILPATFSVELIIDNREVRSKTDRDYIQDSLRTRGVIPLVRPLEIGDALWVAKCKDPQLLSRLGEEGDEIVLDWIVERKRLDDLIGSIKDGRFHEQKFRLNKSGLKNVVYLVEEISISPETAEKYYEQVMSAIASTQVVDGFFVKRTKKLDDTIRYLARMTAMLKRLYESKPLHLIPSLRLSPQTYRPLLTELRKTQPTVRYSITYHSFASLCSKSESLTLRDVFLKMLMCTRGITGDKALEIQKHWKTPRELIEALQREGEGEDGQKRRAEMVWKVAGGLVGRRKIGKVASAKVAEVWGER